MEIITKTDVLPRRLSTAERRHRLEDEWKVSDKAIGRVEAAIRKGLWKRNADKVNPRHKEINVVGRRRC